MITVKTSCVLLFSVMFSLRTMSQVGIGTTTPNSSAVLDVESTEKGILMPRMTESERDLINGGSPSEGLLIYNTDENCLNVFNGTSWVSLCNSGTSTPDPLPANITLTAGQIGYIASVYDEDYLPYSAPTNPAQTGSSVADGSAEATTIDIQGVLNTTTGLNVNIPYTVVGGSVNLPAFSQTQTVISDHVQGSTAASTNGGGTPVDVILSYDAATLSVGSGVITATIKAVSTDLNAVKLDINSGIGTDLGIVLAQFTIATDDAGTTGSIQLKDIPGIPDRRFGETTTQGGSSGQYHNNLYLPVTAEDGNIWLNNNLGAHYANVNHPNFNLAQQATAFNDHNAYGSLFQWGRYSDGHELINYASATSGTSVNGFTSTTSSTDDPGTNLFIINPNNPPLNWRVPREDNLWQGEAGVNNPCPFGYRVPTSAEFSTIISSASLSNYTNAASSALAIPSSGIHQNGTSSAPVIAQGQESYAWSSTFNAANEIDVKYLFFNTNTATVGGTFRTNGFPVRCIQD